MRSSQTSACRPELRRVARRPVVQNVKKIQRMKARHRRRSMLTRLLAFGAWALLIVGTVTVAGVFGFFVGIMIEAT